MPLVSSCHICIATNVDLPAGASPPVSATLKPMVIGSSACPVAGEASAAIIADATQGRIRLKKFMRHSFGQQAEWTEQNCYSRGMVAVAWHAGFFATHLRCTWVGSYHISAGYSASFAHPHVVQRTAGHSLTLLSELAECQKA